MDNGYRESEIGKLFEGEVGEVVVARFLVPDIFVSQADRECRVVVEDIVCIWQIEIYAIFASHLLVQFRTESNNSSLTWHPEAWVDLLFVGELL